MTRIMDLRNGDALIDIDGKLTICDWKTSKEVRSDEMLLNYCHQLGAYNYALRKLTGIECTQALVCIARRSEGQNYWIV